MKKVLLTVSAFMFTLAMFAQTSTQTAPAKAEAKPVATTTVAPTVLAPAKTDAKKTDVKKADKPTEKKADKK